MERQREKAEAVAAVSELEAQVCTATAEYNQIHEAAQPIPIPIPIPISNHNPDSPNPKPKCQGNFGPKGVATTLRKIRAKYKVQTETELESLSEDNLAEQALSQPAAMRDIRMASRWRFGLWRRPFRACSMRSMFCTPWLPPQILPILSTRCPLCHLVAGPR